LREKIEVDFFYITLKKCMITRKWTWN